MYALDTYVASNAQPLQENSQSECAYYCIHITKHNNNNNNNNNNNQFVKPFGSV